MGMYDSIRCLYKIDGKDYPTMDFQTKSLDCTLDWYSIEEDGSLVKFEYEMEEKIPNFKSKKKGMDAFIEERQNWKRKNEKWNPYFFHGDIYFYNYFNEPKQELNFVARYSEGKLLFIKKATENGAVIYKDITGDEFLLLSEMGRYDNEFLKENKDRITLFLIKTNKILNFFGFHKSVKGIYLSTYTQWREKKDLEWQEYYKKNPIVSYKETLKKKPKKKVKKNAK